jgi:hypothetical protein
MIPVAKLIKELQQYPSDALAYAYEGEFIGIVIVRRDKDGREERLGEIPASEWNEIDEKYEKKRTKSSL